VKNIEISNEISSFANDTSGVMSTDSFLKDALFKNKEMIKNKPNIQPKKLESK